jgi:hypothetical protein
MAKSKSTQIFYPTYAAFIVLYSCIFVTIGVLFAKMLDDIFPKFNRSDIVSNKKSKFILYLEVLGQVSSIALITYIFKEYISYFFESISYVKKHKYDSPDKFAALIIIPTIFAVQTSLINKIKFLANSF